MLAFPKSSVFGSLSLTYPTYLHTALCLCPVPCGIYCCFLCSEGCLWFLKSSNCWPPSLRGAVRQGFCLSVALRWEPVSRKDGVLAMCRGLAEHLIRDTQDGINTLRPPGCFLPSDAPP